MSTRVGLLSLGSTTDGSISRTQHPTPARTVLLGPVSTPPVVSRTRAGDAECLGLVQSSLTSNETFHSLKYFDDSGGQETLFVSEC